MIKTNTLSFLFPLVSSQCFCIRSSFYFPKCFNMHYSSLVPLKNHVGKMQGNYIPGFKVKRVAQGYIQRWLNLNEPNPALLRSSSKAGEPLPRWRLASSWDGTGHLGGGIIMDSTQMNHATGGPSGRWSSQADPRARPLWAPTYLLPPGPARSAAMAPWLGTPRGRGHGRAGLTDHTARNGPVQTRTINRQGEGGCGGTGGVPAGTRRALAAAPR